jgi:hypothetical protein
MDVPARNGAKERGDGRMKRIFVAMSMVLFLVGCFHGEVITQVHPGMSIAQVKEVMGEPEGYRKVGDQEVYSYYNKLISGWGWDRADYHYVVKDGVLVSYGAGEIRQNKNTGVVFIVPLR